MARKVNDGRGRMGGRAKGTPNKITAQMRDAVSLLINGCLDNAMADLKALDPFHRMDILCKLMPYIMPKQQALSIDAQIKEEYANLEILLKDAPEDAVDAIAKKVMELNQRSIEEESKYGLAYITQKNGIQY